MGKEIILELPDDADNEEIESFIRESVDEFRDALDLALEEFDSRATLDEIIIDDVSIGADTIGIVFRVEYSVYYGCRDMDGSDVSDERYVGAERRGRRIVFQEHVYPERPTTYEEF